MACLAKIEFKKRWKPGREKLTFNQKLLGSNLSLPGERSNRETNCSTAFSAFIQLCTQAVRCPLLFFFFFFFCGRDDLFFAVYLILRGKLGISVLF